MMATDPRSPSVPPPDQAASELPTRSRALPTDRQLPGLGWKDTGYRHFVPAGTLPMPGEPDIFRAPGCGAVCLRMPPPRDGWEYDYESLPLHPDCQPEDTAEETAVANKKDDKKQPEPKKPPEPKPQRTEREQREAGGWNWED